MHGGTWLAVDRTFQVGISQWPEGRELLVDFRNRKDTSLAAMKSKGGNIRNEAREIIRAIDHYSVRNWKVLKDLFAGDFQNLAYIFKSHFGHCIRNILWELLDELEGQGSLLSIWPWTCRAVVPFVHISNTAKGWSFLDRGQRNSQREESMIYVLDVWVGSALWHPSRDVTVGVINELRKNETVGVE